MDGMSLSFHKQQARIVHPWLEDPTGEAVFGSNYKDRVFVQCKRVRELLMQYASKGVGLEQTQHNELLQRISCLPPESRELALLPFLQEPDRMASGNLRSLHANIGMLGCLASSAPACQFMRPCIFHSVDVLLQGLRLSGEQQRQLDVKCPLLHDFLKEHLTKSALPVEVIKLLEAVRKVADAGGRPGQNALSTPDLSQAEMRRAMASKAKSPDADRPPSEWGREEAMLRTCSWGATGPRAWEKSPLGGNDVFRRLRRYAADRHSSSAICNKMQRSSLNLLPGCVFYWCISCRRCVFFHVMGDAESPRTIFDVLYTRWKTPPKVVCMDNGCNLHDFMLNREPLHFRNVEMHIDEPHFRGHKRCCPAYNTGAYSILENSPLAEQKNRFLRSLESQLSYMKQSTFMWFLRYFVYKLNKLEETTRKNQCFFR